MTRPTKLIDAEIADNLTEIKNWKLLETGEIARTFTFTGSGDFITAIAFVNAAANLAEAVQHHPDIDIRYSRITCFLSTHDVGGLTTLDFEMAKQLDSAFDSLVKPCD